MVIPRAYLRAQFGSYYKQNGLCPRKLANILLLLDLRIGAIALDGWCYRCNGSISMIQSSNLAYDYPLRRCVGSNRVSLEGKWALPS